jgi:uncharacterized membrane protein
MVSKFIILYPRIINNSKQLQHNHKLLYNKTNRRTNFQIYSGMKLYMFWAVPLPVIPSYPLTIRHWHMLYRFDDSLRAGCTQGYITQVVEPMHKCETLSFKIHGLKYINHLTHYILATQNIQFTLQSQMF